MDGKPGTEDEKHQEPVSQGGACLQKQVNSAESKPLGEPDELFAKSEPGMIFAKQHAFAATAASFAANSKKRTTSTTKTTSSTSTSRELHQLQPGDDPYEVDESQYALLDSACTSCLHSRAWREAYETSLPEGVTCSATPNRKQFNFANGQGSEKLPVMRIPIYLAGAPSGRLVSYASLQARECRHEVHAESRRAS